MCEACGPSTPTRIDPELMERFRQTLRDRGTDADAVADPACYGNRHQKFLSWFEEFRFNLGIMLGRA